MGVMRRETKKQVLVEGAEGLGWALVRGPLDSEDEIWDRTQELREQFRARHGRGSFRYLARLSEELDAYEQGESGSQCTTLWVWTGSPTRATALLEVSTWRAKGDADIEVLKMGSYFTPMVVDGVLVDLPIRGAEVVARADLDMPGKKVLGIFELSAPRREARWGFRVGGIDVMVLFREIPYGLAEEAIAAAERAVAAMYLADLR